MCTDERINAITTTIKLLFVIGGMNDFIKNIQLGTLYLDNVDTSTFYRACNAMFKKLVLRLPTTKILYMGCTYGAYKDGTTLKNELGLTSVDYGKVVWHV